MAMRILNTTTFELVSGEQSAFKQEGYAILSHRWVGLEINFEQVQRQVAQLRSGTTQPTPQLAKIRGACDRAREHGLSWMWIDTCCINKASTVEESEAINSMFRWYRDSKLCITYLNDVEHTGNGGRDTKGVFASTNPELKGGPSEWFSRGWTLQELLAPRAMQFYDRHWRYMGTKHELAGELARLTRIDGRYLTGAAHFGAACIAAKMSWMSGRTTGRPEDLAYSMLGIFNVVMTPQYGEGMRAFTRLQQLMLSSSPDESLFAWRMPKSAAGEGSLGTFAVPGDWADDEWGLLAPSPACFRDSNNLTINGRHTARVHGGFVMTQQGLQIPVFDLGKSQSTAFLFCPLWMLAPLAHWLYVRHVRTKDILFPLNCWRLDGQGQSASVQLSLRRTTKRGTGLKRVRCHNLDFTYERDSDSRAQRAEPMIVRQPEQGYLD